MGKNLAFGPFRLNADDGTLFNGSSAITIGSRAAALLRTLIEARGAVVSKSALMDAVWPGVAVEESNLTVQIAALRRVLGKDWIATAVRNGYRFAGPVVEQVTMGPAESGSVLAVLPFENAGGDPGERYFTDGIAREIITTLSRFAGVTVLAANSSFRLGGLDTDLPRVIRELGARYALEGSVLRFGTRVRVAVRLLQTETGAHSWAERYDREIDDVFALQDDIADKIAGTLVAHLTRAERERVVRQRSANPKAYDLYLQALDESRIWSTADAARAEQLLRQVLALEPALAAAHALLARYLVGRWLEPRDAQWRDPTVLREAWMAARTAVERNPRLPASHDALAWVLCWRHEQDAAIVACRRARDLNPAFAEGRRGHVLCIAGEPDEGMLELRKSLTLDPFHPPMLLGWIAHCHLMRGEPGLALELLRECVARAPGWRPGHVWRVAASMQLDLQSEARDAAADVMAIDPAFSVGQWQGMHGYRDEAAAAAISAALRESELPE